MSPLQLHVDLQIPGGLFAGWNKLPRVTPLHWPSWGNSMGRNWGSLSLIALAPRSCKCLTVCPCYVMQSVDCNDARPCLGNKILSFLLIIYFCMKTTNRPTDGHDGVMKLQLELKKESIEVIDNTKLLDAIIRNYLKWDLNTSTIVKKANARKAMLALQLRT